MFFQQNNYKFFASQLKHLMEAKTKCFHLIYLVLILLSIYFREM